jgi:hypothetical protein
MPYSVHKIGNKYCVQKKEGKSYKTVPGGCHETKEKAERHMTAIRMHTHE